jgi:hypothetical protein
LKFYKYLYYRIYSWNLKRWGSNDIPHWNALFGVSYMMLSNVFIVGAILEIYGIEFFDDQSIRQLIICLANLILIINYFCFVFNKKYLKISKEFSNEDKRKRNLNALLLWVYAIITFLLPFFLVNLNK